MLTCKRIISIFMSCLLLCGCFSFVVSATGEICTEHNFDEGTVVVESTCKEAGQKQYRCLDCGVIKLEALIPAGHIYDEDYLVIEEIGGTCVIEGKRTYTLTCPVCEEIILNIEEPYTTKHEWEFRSTILYPTCYDYGIQLWGCKNCDATEERRTLPQHTGLKGTGEWDVCFDYSQYSGCYECGGHGYIYYTGSHDFLIYNVEKEATCTESGSAYVQCRRQSCEYYNGGYMTINPLGHDIVYEKTVAPDCCVRARQGGSYCATCGEVFEEPVYSDEYFEHKFKVDVVAVAEGTAKGKTKYTCQNETWSSMFHVYEVEYSVADVVPGVSEDGKLTVNTDKSGVIGNIRDITGIYEENITFEAVEENGAVLDENGNIIASDSGSIAVKVITPSQEAVVVIDVVICDTLEILAEEQMETGRVLELDVVKNPGSIKADNVKWTSSDDSIVFVSDGKLVAVGTGKVTLTATTADGLTVSKEITLVATSDVRKVTFSAIEKMHYMVEDYFAVFNGETLYWSNSGSMTFKVRVYETFPFETYIVYMNGKEISPDADGYYTVTAESGDVRITVTGAMYEENDDGVAEKVSFWQAIINFFKKILAFFGMK